MKKPRNLSREERALWDRVAARTEPLQDRPAPFPDPPKFEPISPLAPEKPPLTNFRVGEKVDHKADHDLMAGISQQLRDAPVRMDKKAHGKMTRGKLKPEARIDLHGMTLAQAHPSLISFILSSHAAGHRLVLVITGKGRGTDDGGPIPVRHGRLRHEVPHWLRTLPLGSVVLQVSEAHRRHGGHGALYVYLRRAR